jgi:hypothetical protein
MSHPLLGTREEELPVNEIEVLTLGDLRRILRRGRDDVAVPVEVDFDGRRISLYGIIAETIALHTMTNMENDDLL